MFKKVILDNFLSFDHLEFDLTGHYGRPKSFALVYGENGSGKSNLISSFLFLKESLSTLSTERFTERMKTALANDDQAIDLDTLNTADIARLTYVMKRGTGSLKKLTQGSKLIGSSEGIHVWYEFYLNEKAGYYELCFNEENQLTKEKLKYVGEERTVTLFEISGDSASKDGRIEKKLSSKLFKDYEYRNEIETHIDQLWGKHTFGAILLDEIEKKNPEYIKSSLNANVCKALDFFDSFTIQCDVKPASSVGYGKISRGVFAKLEKGVIQEKEKKDLMVCEEALNDFFCSLYSDVKKVYYSLDETDKQIKYELFFTKLIGGELRDVPFDFESTGTVKLLEQFPAFFEAAKGGVAFIDEIDTGIHDLLMRDVLLDVSASIGGQLIASTHNTMLIEEISAESVYILDIDSNGCKSVKPISELVRTQVNNNNRTRYLAGAFGGIPTTAPLAFKEIVDFSVEAFESNDSC